MHKQLFLVLLVLAAALPLALGTPAAFAQSTSASAPNIDGFDVEPVPKSVPGRELIFTLYGSPGGSAVVKISGATGSVVLAETESGVYEGTYTIRSRDKITAASTATANLRLGNKVASTILDEPLIGRPGTRRPPPPVASAMTPTIERFDIDAPTRIEAGEELLLSLTGTPAGTASATISGVKGKIMLNEARSGVYEGRYTIKNRDRVSANSAVSANLRVAGREANTVSGQSLSQRAIAPAANRPVESRAKLCGNCGVVEAVNVVEVKGEGTYLGKIAGGIAGALLGSQVGQGRGTTVAEVAGAAGGAFAGNEIEKRYKTVKHHEVLVRLENGGTQTVSYVTAPPFAVGARVRVENNTLVAR
jgi:outer membrane lipoprotein SlyB